MTFVNTFVILWRYLFFYVTKETTTMKFNKKQQQIIKLIMSGDIFDLFSYIKHFKLGENISYDKEEISKLFTQDNICKDYYYSRNLKPIAANIMTSDIFLQKVNAKEIDESKYIHRSLSINFCTGIQEVFIDNQYYKINFYNGVYVAKSFESIIDFLSLWQYLKSEMLVLEVPNEITPETIGLFFEKNSSLNADTSISSTPLQDIDYSTFSYSDEHYIKNDIYSFSNEHYTICRDFLSKRIYPTPQLNLFIQKKFRTTAESAQQSALSAAWLAIIVSIILTFMPYIYSQIIADKSESQTCSVDENIEHSVSDNSIYSNFAID